MSATVLLRHQTPDGGHHYDWMIVRDGVLLTFRVRERIDRGVPAFAGERLEDHRAAYLAYEGEIPGGRGRVERLADGDLRIVRETAEEIEVHGALGAARGVFRGRAAGSGQWDFRFEPQKGGPEA